MTMNKMWLAVILVYTFPNFVFSDDCSTQLYLFGDSRIIPCYCELIVRPSVLSKTNAIRFSCDEKPFTEEAKSASILFLPKKELIRQFNKKSLNYEARSNVRSDGLEESTITSELFKMGAHSNNKPIYVKSLCNDEYCMSIFSSNLDHIQDILHISGLN